MIGENGTDWSADHDDRKSTAGYFFELRLSGGAASEQTKKQQAVVSFSVKAEYRGLAAAVQEASFLRPMLSEKGYQQMQVTVNCETNQRHRTVIRACDAQSIETHRHKMPFHTRKSRRQI